MRTSLAITVFLGVFSLGTARRIACPTRAPTTQAPTTKTTPKPTIPPPTCFYSKDIFNEQGVYKKTACLSDSGQNHTVACLAVGLNLYTIDTVKDKSELFDWMITIFGEYSYAALWVNGGEDANDNWVLQNGNPISSVISEITVGTANNGVKECARVIAETDVFTIGPYDCSQGMLNVCEYIKS